MSQNPSSVVPSEDCDLTEGVRGVNPHDGSNGHQPAELKGAWTDNVLPFSLCESKKKKT